MSEIWKDAIKEQTLFFCIENCYNNNFEGYK